MSTDLEKHLGYAIRIPPTAFATPEDWQVFRPVLLARIGADLDAEITEYQERTMSNYIDPADYIASPKSTDLDHVQAEERIRERLRTQFPDDE